MGNHGPQGPVGRKGDRGSQGFVGFPGMKGMKGKTGDKGEPGVPGKPLTAPVISSTPVSLIIFETQNVILHCDVQANPKGTERQKSRGPK